MKKFLTSLAIIFIGVVPASSEVVTGVFETPPSEDSGRYLQIEFGSCDDDSKLTCGKIKNGFSKDGVANPEYEHIGKLMVWSMVESGSGKYKNGKIWDPSENNADGSKKIYNSKMTLNDKILTVEGCILFFCKGQDWIRVD